ncbi:M28 family peptidase [Balneola sp. MJW-20]|uniref:M28 family peptidase n=1 Tax=Gracilimonas aurantiaca TaxID=3234185 RepID=UPI00346710DA
MLLRSKNLLILVLVSAVVTLSCHSGNEDDVKLNTMQLIEDLEFISSDSTQGRRTGTDGNRIAREYLIKRLTGIGVKPFRGQYQHPFEFSRRNESYTGINIVAVSEGVSDSMIVISAHYDHIGRRDSLIFNGADDNASGTAALLALADYFSKVRTKHTLVFAAFDAEEMGKRGADAFVADSLVRNKTVLNINMDMIAQNQDNEIYASGTYHYPFLRPVLEDLNTGEIRLLFGHDRPDSEQDDWTYASDQSAFHDAGIPFIYFGVEDHPHYHRHTDGFDTIPQEFYRRSVSLILDAVIAFDEM